MTSPKQHWLHPFRIPLLLSAFIVVLALSGDSTQALLRYDRTAILDGQWWRLLSAHLLHLGESHLLMNLAGLWLIWLLVGSTLSQRSWLILLFVDALITALALLILNPQLGWYVGLSGVLHGLLVAGAIADIRAGHRGTWLLLGAVALKLGWEQLAGPLPGSETGAGGTVIVDAHLYGALGGLLSLLLPACKSPPQPASRHSP
ncbi:hypothetical protein MNBD_GAMMA20-1775 [hydrothermal vent metagenome]|uniref:Peptidase S54 rhomboid domain-containing protein n=1 Tax=hydrothermal vent metagenome TaxID=652676 RepID=A0A3B1AQD8_9ZZZZ